MKSEWDVFDTSFYTNNKNVILTGAPGTGKTYLAKKIAEKITGSDERMGFVQFHPSYDYADFVEGLRPKEYNGQVTFELVKGTFKTFCEKALVDWIAWMVKKLENLNNDDESKKKDASKEDLSIWLSRWKEYKTAITDYADFPKYVFIIDEINRGEMSKIFGELFFSIDPGYRGTDGMVSTQYANMVKTHNLFDLVLNNGKMGQFFVPENVYIIGTMNDIDRSVESMDFAFRRRFAFKEIYATDDMIRTLDYNAKTIIRLIGTMERVNKAIISEEVGLTEAYQLGGSYFLKIKNYYEENSKTQKEEQLEQALKKLWDFHLRGTLYEYFRGEPDADEKLKIIEDAYTNNG